MASSVGEENDGDFLKPFKDRPLTVVAVGKTGKGKSSTLNSILKVLEQKKQSFKSKLFASSYGPDSVTDEASSNEFTLDILNLVCFVSDFNEGKPYTNIAFEEAQRCLEEEKKQIREDLNRKFNAKLDEKLKPIEDKHQEALTSLQERIAQKENEEAKLREDQIVEREQFQNELVALKVAQEEEKIRLEKDKQQAIDRVEKEKRTAYEKERLEMNATIALLAAKVKETEADMQKKLHEAKEKARKREENCCIL